MATKKQVDISCMFCGNTPCTCEGVAKPKKAVAPKKKLADTPVVPVKQESITPPVKRASLASMSSSPQMQPGQPAEESEREALTALFKGGFIIELVGDSRGFDAVRPMLNMSPIDIDIQLWKIKRSKCQAQT